MLYIGADVMVKAGGAKVIRRSPACCGTWKWKYQLVNAMGSGVVKRSKGPSMGKQLVRSSNCRPR